MIDMLKALAEENRLKIVTLLSKGSLCVCEIEKEVKLPQNLVSHHLGVLKEAGIIENCRCGKNNYYSLNRAAIKDFIKALNKIGGSNEN
jgi:ArsR family transcriptional regulator